MLNDAPVIGFIPCTDYEAARAFYVGKLGLEFVSLDQFALVVRAGASMIRIVKFPAVTPAQGTTLGWEVRDIEGTVRSLRDRGVDTEKFPFVADKELGIWTGAYPAIRLLGSKTRAATRSL